MQQLRIPQARLNSFFAFYRNFGEFAQKRSEMPDPASVGFNLGMGEPN
jgi:hypothetical protein